MSRARNWVFTDFSLSKDYIDCMGDRLTYICVGLETCPETGRQHHQGYMELSNQITRSALKKALKNTEIHLEPAKGSPTQNKQYCSKENLIIEHGTPKQQGKRSDIETIREGIKAGHCTADIIAACNSIQGARAVEQIRAAFVKPRTTKPLVEWYWGPTGTGKTKTAHERLQTFDNIKLRTPFVIGYEGGKNVLIDDFRGRYAFEDLLQMLDRYRCRIETKGGSMEFAATHIIITSSKHPKDVYTTVNEDIQQLLRRIDRIVYFNSEVDQNHLRSSNVSEVAGNTRGSATSETKQPAEKSEAFTL